MTQTTTSAPLPVIPPEVATFAAEQGGTEYLPALLALVQRAFPQSRITVLLEEDLEIANDWYIVFEADVAGMSAEQIFAAQRQWSKERFTLCPSTHQHLFRLGMA
jgi:hypothetical protein